MIIKNIKINRYKSIKRPISFDFLPINIFIGQNNCGKSNILDAIEFAFDKELDNSNLFYPNADIELTLQLTDDEQKEYSFKKQEKLICRNGKRELLLEKDKIVNNKAIEALKFKVKRLNEKAFSDFERIEKDYHSLFNYPDNLKKFNINLKDHFPKISATKNALDIKYEHKGLYEDDRRVTMDYLGSGFGRAFTILLYVFHPEYSAVMINEPETHLHPALIKKLLWAMENSNADQIIFTTHSPLFITPATLPQVVRVVKGKKNTEIYTLEEGKYNYKRLIQELNADNLEMFFADKVVLVEGASDKLLIQGLINKFYKGDKEIKVIQTYGKSNTSIYVDLLNIFKIPFLIVLDKDVVKTHHLREIMHHLNIDLPKMNNDELINKLKEYNIFIFLNGDLESNYPKKYQIEDSKSSNALHAANLVTEADFDSNRMKYLREIIQSI